MAKKDRFELEQQILECWGICEDLDTLMEAVLEQDLTRDSIANVLLGMKELYSLKFQRTFNTFESLVHDKRII